MKGPKGCSWKVWTSIAAVILVSSAYLRSWKVLNQLSPVPSTEWILVPPGSDPRDPSDVVDDNHHSREAFNQDSKVERSTSAPTPTNINSTNTATVPHVPGGAFIHVGKTGGSTLSGYLRNACHSYIPKPCGVIPNETIISTLISDYYHVPDFFRMPRQIHSFYLISLRDPLERTISGFVFGHPNNAKVLGEGYEMWKRKRTGYFNAQCFETLETFVQNIGDNSLDFAYPYRPIYLVRDNCTNFCRAMIHGRVKRMVHLFFNFQKLHSLLPNSTQVGREKLQDLTIYATRKEHLMDDFERINRILGESKQLRQTPKLRDVSNTTLPVTRDLSDQGRQRLCRALEGEYRIFVEFLFQAKNFNRENVEESLDYSNKRCPELEILSRAYWKERLEATRGG